MQVEVHLERLRRHYELAVKTYDLISLLDLSHSLRMWADLKESLPKAEPRFNSTRSFKSASPARKALKAVKGLEAVFTYLPGGVTTFAHEGEMAMGPWIEEKGKITMVFSFRATQERLTIYKFCVALGILDKSFSNTFASETVKRCNFQQWLGAECVRWNRKDSTGKLELITISREKLIRRVANSLDGSHPSKDESEVPLDKFDSSIRYLLQIHLGGLPLPYFILLKCAQDILDTAPKLLGLDVSNEQT